MKTPLQLPPRIVQRLFIHRRNNNNYFGLRIVNIVDSGLVNNIFDVNPKNKVERSYVRRLMYLREGTISSYPSLRRLFIQIGPNLQNPRKIPRFVEKQHQVADYPNTIHCTRSTNCDRHLLKCSAQ